MGKLLAKGRLEAWHCAQTHLFQHIPRPRFAFMRQAFFDSYDSAAAALDAALQAAGVEQVQGAAAAVPSALPASQQQQQALAAETAAPVMKQELVAAA